MKKLTLDGRKKNVIKAENIKRASSSKVQTFNIKASEKGNAKITYKSDNKLVKVNSPGRITLSPNYIRSAIITISASATDTYEVATKKIKVTVMAARLTILKVENDKKESGRP